MPRRTFRIVLIKPTHYGDDGYAIQWWRSTIPSNSLASVYALMAQCKRENVLGSDTDIEIEAYDDSNIVVNVRRAIARLRQADAGFVGLVGVQSNQYPRAIDLARQFRAADIPVVIGGFRVSGCLSMLPELPLDIREALDMGITLYAGEAEGRMAELLRDVDGGRLKPIYNYLSDLPDLADAVPPLLPPAAVRRVLGSYSSFDAGRGCPFQCSFCTIINVQGRKSRRRTADDVEAIVRANAKHGITRFFVTDDNFARNKDWEPILDRLIQLRREGLKIRLILQVDAACHKIPGFIQKAAAAGCNNIYIGLENINPDNLLTAKKRQNKIWEYRQMLQEWKRARVMTYAGFILGFPNDTPESLLRDVETVQRELPLDLGEFMILTPLPGSEDHKNLYLRQVAMDRDLNKYDLEHVTTAHPVMSAQELQTAYFAVWERYYTDAHIETILRRTAAVGANVKKMALMLTLFAGSVPIENVHPVQIGIIRRKVRTQRRHGMKIENPLVFYTRRAYEVAANLSAWARLFLRYERIRRKVMADPARKDYVDDALRPAAPDHVELPDFVRAHADKLSAAQRKQMAAVAS